MKQTAFSILKAQVWGLTKASLLSFVLYLASFMVMNVAFYSDVPLGERDFTPIYAMMMVIFQIAFYYAYTKRRCEEAGIRPAAHFDPIADGAAYLRGEGKYMAGVLLLLAAISEASVILTNHAPQNPVATALSFMFSFAQIVQVPILGHILAAAITMAGITAVTVYKHGRDNRYWVGRDRR